MPNNYISHLKILNSDIIEIYRRIELRRIVLPVPSNQIKISFIVILPFNLVHWDFFVFHIEIEGKCGWIIGGGGGAKGMLAPSQIIGGPAPPPPPPPGHPLPTLMCPPPPPPPPPRPPSSYAYVSSSKL